MSDLLELAKQIIPPVLAGAGGVLGTLWRMTKGVKAQVQELTTIATKNVNDIALLRKEVGECHETQRALAASLGLLKKDIEENCRRLSTLDTLWANFSGEQNEQWQQMNRALGQIEGMLQTHKGGR